MDSRVLLGFALLGIVLGLLALAALQYLNKQQRGNLTRKIEELETAKGTADAPAGKESFALTIAKVKQDEAITELRKATNVLEKLSAEVSQLFKMGETLPTNQNAARQFFVKAVESSPTLPQIRVKLAEIDPAIVQIENGRGTAYLPDLHVVSDARKTVEWASTTSAAVIGFRDRLEQILRDAKTEVATASPAPIESPQPAKASDTRSGTVEQTNILTEMKAEAERILAETKAEAARILDETENEVKRILAETQRKAEAILVATKEKAPVQEIARAPETPKDRPTTVTFIQEVREPEKKKVAPEPGSPEFQQLIANAKIRSQLLPFTTPGNMRLPGMFRAQKMPISLSQLKSFGALEPGMDGLERLVEVASTPQDAVRPRWKFKMKRGVWQRKPNEIAQARTVQQLFIDFGPDFVQAGLLAE